MIERKKPFKHTLQQYVPHLLAVFVLLLLVHDVFGTHGFLAMREKQQAIEKVRQELDRTNKENAELQRNLQDLKSDPETIKRIAREEMNMAGQGETIIKLPAPKPNASSTGSVATKP